MSNHSKRRVRWVSNSFKGCRETQWCKLKLMGLPSTRDPYYPELTPPYDSGHHSYQRQYPGYIDVTPRPQPQPKPKYWLHITLFLLTIASTTLIQGWLFSASLLAILTAHEFGHYFTAKYWGVPATLPYFIPFPSLFGTLGAVIKMSPRIPHRRALFDIASTGPLAGLMLALPLTFYGVSKSTIVPTSVLPENVVNFHDPLIFRGILWLADTLAGIRVATSLPNLSFPGWEIGVIQMGPGFALLLHPIALAGWAGLFVTALNLLPIGQLDGGHITHSLFDTRSHAVARTMFVGLLAFSLWKMTIAWIPMMVLLLIFGVRHPRQMDDGRPLGTSRILLGALLAIIFVTCFSLTPITL
jgi:membrane-associated protease RseP (regulator of RpoE activity)